MNSKDKITIVLLSLLDAAEQGKMPEHEAGFILQEFEARFKYLHRKQPSFYDDLLEALYDDLTPHEKFGSN